MCVASTGKVIEINDGIAKIEYATNIIKASTGIVDVKVGDRVLVHAGLIIQVLPDEEADFMEDIFRELEELGCNEY